MMSFEHIRATARAIGVHVVEQELPDGVCGLYDDKNGVIYLHDGLNDRQRRCTMCHELIHAAYRDPGCDTEYGLKAERRTRRLTAMTMIDADEYARLELAYDGHAWPMATELGVTMQVLDDYRELIAAGRIARPALIDRIREGENHEQ